MQSSCPSKGVQNDLKIAGVLGALQVDILAFFFRLESWNFLIMPHIKWF